jgi:hypothetical protein
MGRTRRFSKILEKAEVRSQSIKSINATLDLGSGLSAASFDQAINDTRTKLQAYNQAIATIDEKQNDLNESEKFLNDLSERMLAGIGAHFGRDSNEYEKAGGTRKSERKRPARKADTPTQPG